MQKKKGTIVGKKASNQTGKREKRRIIQLLCCAILFLVVFAGKELKGAQEYRSGQRIHQMIQENTDFGSVFKKLEDIVSGNLEELAVEVFGVSDQTEDAETSGDEAGGDVGANTEHLSVSQDAEPEAAPVQTEVPTPQETQSIQEQTPPEEPEVSPEAEVYTGLEPPEGATMEYFELDLTETVTPVLGRLTSPYGYREHPINGGNDFHVGVDLSAEIGTPVLSFASGTVDFIGESDGYGLYVQIDHGNGVKTFYCHCSQLCVRKGMKVDAGEMIAKTGNTGNTTGPHLHMEIKLNDVLINPEYYIEVLPQ